MTEMYERRLNEIEYLNWLIGQPFNISMAITIRGNLQKELLRKSLENVQRKHPILQTQLYVNEKGKPSFIWNEISQIPLEVISRANNDLYKEIVAKEFITPFETGINCSEPLIRVKLLKSKTVSDLIITMQHVIGDGMSMAYLMRDIIDFMVEPEKKVEPLEVIKNLEDILPTTYQKKIPKTPRKFKIILWFIKRLSTLGRFKRKLGRMRKNQKEADNSKFKESQFLTRDWVLTEDQSQVFIKKCKENGVTVHSAICTLFLPDIPFINNAVNLRKKLEYDLGESVGLYSGGLVIRQKYKERHSFWRNSQIYYKKLVNGLNSDKIYRGFKLVPRTVPPELFNELMSLYQGPANTWITNLGSLDIFNIYFASKGYYLENLYGGVAATSNTLMIAVFTIEKKIHFHIQYFNPPYTEEEIENYVKNAINQLNNALKH